MYRLMAAIAAALLVSVSAFAQSAPPVTSYPAGWSPRGNTAALAVSSVSGRVVLGWVAAGPTAPPSVLVCNTGAVNAYVTLGGSTVTATTGGVLVAAGYCPLLALNGASYIAAITSSSTTNLSIMAGSGGSQSSLPGAGGPGSFMLSTGLNATSAAFGNLVSAAGSAATITLGSTPLTFGASTTTIAGLTLTSPVLTTPALGTPASGVLTNATGLPISTGISGLAAGVATFLATPSSANLLAALTTKTGTGLNVFDTAPTISALTVTGLTTIPGGGSISSAGRIYGQTTAGGAAVSDATVPIQVGAAASTPAFFGANKSSGYGMLIGFDPSLATPAGVVRMVSADPLNVIVNNTLIAATFLSSGNVGIKNIIPQALLDIGTTAATARTRNLFTDASNGEWAYLGSWGLAANVATYGADKNGTGTYRNTQFVGGGSTVMTVDASMKVGVGVPVTTAPFGKFHVRTAASGAASANSLADSIVIESSLSTGISILTPNNHSGYLLFGDNDSNARGWVRYDHADDSLSLIANGASKLDYGKTTALIWTLLAPIATPGYTVAGLPTGVVGARAHVTNQLTTCAAAGAALTGGGALTCPAFHNGTAWVGG